jgi:preprotein translocase subunit SecB
MNEESEKLDSGEEYNRIAEPKKIYLKDASFESPHSPEIFLEDGWTPKLDLDIDSESQELGNDTYNVVIKVTAKVTSGESTAFLAEVHQAGIFVLKGFNSDRLERRQNVFCLRILYPYASAALSDLVTKGGFPSLLLPPVNFSAIYNQRSLRRQQSSEDDSVAMQE